MLRDGNYISNTPSRRLLSGSLKRNFGSRDGQEHPMIGASESLTEAWTNGG